MQIKKANIVVYEIIEHNGETYKRYGPTDWEKLIGGEDWTPATYPKRLEEVYQDTYKGERFSPETKYLSNEYTEVTPGITVRLHVQMPWADSQWQWQQRFDEKQIIEVLRPLLKDREIHPAENRWAHSQRAQRESIFDHMGDVLRKAFKNIVEKQDPVLGYDKKDLESYKAPSAETDPRYDPKECEHCLREAQEEGVAYEASFIWHDDGWHCAMWKYCLILINPLKDE